MMDGRLPSSWLKDVSRPLDLIFFFERCSMLLDEIVYKKKKRHSIDSERDDELNVSLSLLEFDLRDFEI